MTSESRCSSHKMCRPHCAACTHMSTEPDAVRAMMVIVISRDTSCVMANVNLCVYVRIRVLSSHRLRLLMQLVPINRQRSAAVKVLSCCTARKAAPCSTPPTHQRAAPAPLSCTVIEHVSIAGASEPPSPQPGRSEMRCAVSTEDPSRTLLGMGATPSAGRATNAVTATSNASRAWIGCSLCSRRIVVTSLCAPGCGSTDWGDQNGCVGSVAACGSIIKT